MKQTLLSTKVRKENPSDEEAKNAIFLIRAGYISKATAGVYGFLPLGFRSLRKIMDIIREEMDLIGGQEVFLNSIQDSEIWKKTGRWGNDAEEVWFKSNLSSGSEIGFGWTHEETITEAMKHHIYSYRDLPIYQYQLQTKFRNEKRAKNGIMRTREFIMKDLYSFSKDESEHKEFYERCADAYMKIFNRVGIGNDTYRTFASGGAFSEFSDEFQTITPVGEDIIYVNREKKIALNKEVYNDEILDKLQLNKEELEEVSASEVGNIFTLGTRFSDSLGLHYTDENGNLKPVFMGSYGIGPARLLGILVEKFSSNKEMVLPDNVAPFKIHILAIGDSDLVLEGAEFLYNQLRERNVDVLFDNRNIGPGEKFAESDLMGIPYRIIISENTILSGKYEYINRITKEKLMLDQSADSVVKVINHA